MSRQIDVEPILHEWKDWKRIIDKPLHGNAGHDDYVDQESTSTTLRTCIEDLENAPTVEPVIHAHWEEYNINAHGYRCSHCRKYIREIGYVYPYCPNCGAKMDEVVRDDE